MIFGSPCPNKHKTKQVCQQDAYPANNMAVTTVPHPAPPFQGQHLCHSVHGSIYSTQGIETDVYARLPNIILASCDLIIDFLTLRSTVSALAPICIENGSFHSFSLEVGNRRMNGQTDGQRNRLRTLCLKPVYTAVQIKTVRVC